MTDRYLRHNLIDWFDQELLKKLHVLVIGAGAVGNEVIKNLALLGVGAIRIVDFDRIEVHNLTRSVLFSEADVGKYKSEAAANFTRLLDPHCKVEAVCGDFWDCISFAQLQEASAVFCCVDNFEARIRLNKLCSLLRVDLINAGIDSRSVSAELFPFSRSSDSACYECNLPPSTYQRIAERYSCGWLKKVAFAERKIPTTAITASYAGALATSLFLYSFRDDAEDGARQVFLDTIAYSISRTQLPKNPSCPSCSSNRINRTVLRAQRTIGRALPWLCVTSGEVALTVSDPILVGWDMPNCLDCEKLPTEIVFDEARRFDDSDAICPKCNLKQRLAVIREKFTIRELIEKFQGREMPGKFVTLDFDDTQLIVELEDREEE